MNLQTINVVELNDKETVDVHGGALPIGVGGLWDNSRFFEGFFEGFEAAYRYFLP